MDFWAGRKVLVTGGAGFIGSSLAKELLDAKADVTICDNFSAGSMRNVEMLGKRAKLIRGDLREPKVCLDAVRDQEVIMNLAAKVEGVSYNQSHQVEMFRENMLIGMNMLEAARHEDVESFLSVSSACVYPRFSKTPTSESEGFREIPEPSNEGYGWSKRMIEFLSRQYAREYGMRIAIARPYNCYGPRDHFDSKSSHVIPALIRRIFQGENPLQIWGDGSQTRTFIFVSDLVEGLMLISQKYAVADPLNLAGGEEVPIKELVKLLLSLTKKDLGVYYDASMPAGQPRRKADISKAAEKIGFKPKTGLRSGLLKTIEYYKREIADASKR